MQCTFHARLFKVLSQLPDLPESSKPSMLDYSKHKKWVRPVVHDTIPLSCFKADNFFFKKPFTLPVTPSSNHITCFENKIIQYRMKLAIKHVKVSMCRIYI